MIAAARLKLGTVGALNLLTEGTVNLDVVAIVCALVRVFMVNLRAPGAFIENGHAKS